MSDESSHPSGLPLLLKIPFTGAQLSCSGRFVYDLVELGLLDLVKLGDKSSRITRESVLRLAAQRAKPADCVPGLVQFTETKKNPARRASGRRRHETERLKRPSPTRGSASGPNFQR